MTGVTFPALVALATLTGLVAAGTLGGSAGVSRRKSGVTLTFWLITLVTSVLVGFGLYRVFALALGG